MMKSNILLISIVLLYARNVFSQTPATDGGIEGHYDACNGTTAIIYGTNGTILSPDFPDNYPNEINCTWSINVTDDMVIGFKFSVFDVEDHPSCIYDSITVYEGDDNEILAMFCGDEIRPLVSNGNEVLVHFQSDVSETGKGFKLHWFALGRDVIKPTSGEITSPNYPQHYPNSISLIREISVKEGCWIQFEFNEPFEIADYLGENLCPYDFLEIEDPHDAEYPVERFCGSDLPKKAAIPNNKAIVRFKSDFGNSSIGFNVTWSQVELDGLTCTDPVYVYGTKSDNEGFIINPTYPFTSHLSTECVWYITGPPNTYVAITFEEFDVVMMPSGLCYPDTYLKIYDGDTMDPDNMYLKRPLCNTLRPPRGFRSSTNAVVIEYSTGGSRRFGGFKIKWKLENECPTGEFLCWNGSCINDSLVCDGTNDCPSGADEMQEQCYLTAQCGVQDIQPNFKWHPRVIGGYEVEPYSWPWQGLLLRGDGDSDPRFICGTTVISERWAMTAAHCTASKQYTFYVHFGIHSRVNNTNNPHAQLREIDLIMIHPDWTGDLDAGNDITLLRMITPLDFTSYVQPICLSTGPSTDPHGETPGVVLGWGQLMPFARLYPEFMQQGVVPILTPEDCVKYHPDNNNETGILEGHICVGYVRDQGGIGPCYGDSGGALIYFDKNRWVQVGITSWGIVCGGPSHPGYYTRVSNVYASFIEPTLSRTFNLRETSSNIDVSGDGVLKSTNYPDVYPDTTRHTWILKAAANQRIVLNVNDNFNLEFEENCLFDNLTIFDGANMFLDQAFCGRNPPPTFRSITNEIRIVFMTDESFAGSGFGGSPNIGFEIIYSVEENCASGYFHCADGDCINLSKVCDRVKDCRDGSDEQQCVWDTNLSCQPEYAPVFPQQVSRMTGASIAVEGSWPWMVLMYDPEIIDFIYCNGAIIASKYIITSASCVEYDAGNLIVEVGKYISASNSSQFIAVDYSILHPSYRQPYYRSNNLAIAKLKDEIIFSDMVKPICLSDFTPYYSEDKDVYCVTASWGPTTRDNRRTDDLRQLRLPILSNETQACADFYRESQYAFFDENLTLPDEMICAGTLNIRNTPCDRDQGAPLMCYHDQTWSLGGVLSAATCRTDGFPALFSRVSHYNDWINKTLVTEALKPDKDTEIIMGDSGTLASPGYDEAPFEYENNLEMSWLIVAPENTHISGSFENNTMDVEFETSCDFDHVELRDGKTNDARRIFDKDLCGVLNLHFFPAFETSGNHLYVKFVTDSTEGRRGFKLTWTTSTSCMDDQFRCFDSSCIADIKQCDGTEDCPDASDEVECSLNVTVSPECGVQKTAPNFNWSPRIVGGGHAVPGSWPWQVAIGQEEFIYCGGSLINEQWILTAAHCISGETEDVRVYVGLHDIRLLLDNKTQEISVTDIYVHPQEVIDFALMKLETPAKLGDKVQKVCISNNTGFITGGQKCVITGWGASAYQGSSSNILQQARVTMYSRQHCINYKNESEYEFSYEDEICAGVDGGGIDSCQGDSGGPLVCKVDDHWVQFGVVSNGIGCAIAGHPGLYADVATYYDWIQQTMEERSDTTTAAPTEVPCGCGSPRQAKMNWIAFLVTCSTFLLSFLLQ